MDFKWLWRWPENKQPEEEESDSESESEEGSSEAASTSALPSTTPLIPPQEKPVNPKVFFANERTFLHWMQFCTVLGAISVGMIDYGDKIAQIGGLIFTLVSLFLMFYALVRFHERGNRLAKREKGLYDDKLGAYIAVGVILLAVGINFTMRL